ncbi:MAG: tetratricopeptide repeat protein [Promethearchaeota archaeon]
MNKEEIDTLLEQGEKFERNSDFKRAIQYFEKILQIDPTNYQAKLHLILVYSKSGDLEKAKSIQNNLNRTLDIADRIEDEDLKISKLLDSLINNKKNNASTKIDHIEGKIDSLIEDIDEELEETKSKISQKVKGPQPIIVYPDKTEIIHDKGVYKEKKQIIEENYKEAINLYQTRQFQQALIKFKEILKLNRKLGPAWFYIGTIYSNIGYFQKSIVYFQRAVELEPKNDTYLSWLSFVYRQLKFLKKSIDIAKKAYDINIENYVALQNMGLSYYALGELRKALWCFVQANSIKQDNNISAMIQDLKQKEVIPFNPIDKEFKLCHRCGNEIRIKAKFCDECGTSLLISEKKKWEEESIKPCLICKQNIVKEKPVLCKTCYFTFHRECLLRWVEVHKRCPNCGNEVGWI